MRTKLLLGLACLTLSLAACGQPPAAEAPAPTEAAAVESTVMVPPTTEVVMPTAASAMTETSGATVKLPEVDPLSVTGDIITSGSSTVFPLTERLAARFKDEGYKGNITVDSIGTGAGFERFCKKGETDIANASRAIKKEEAESCAAIEREPVEFRVGTDALAIVVSTQNTFLQDVTIKDLAAIYSHTYTLWSDVNAEWPKEKIQRFSPGTDSGTFDYFVEAVFAKDKTPILESNPQLSEDDNVLVQGVEGSPYAIGYFGYAYYENNKDKLKALSVEGVAPSRETAHDGTYKLARPLFIYSTAKIMAAKPQVAAFINFFLTYVDEEIDDVGYFTAGPAAADEARTNFLRATGAQ